MLGILLACFRCFRTYKDNYVHSQPIWHVNSWRWGCAWLDCPLLMLMLMFTHNLNFILRSAIQCPVSVIHACSDSCTFYHFNTFTTIEHEAVDTSKIVLKHDWSNDTMCTVCQTKFFAISLVWLFLNSRLKALI